MAVLPSTNAQSQVSPSDPVRVHPTAEKRPGSGNKPGGSGRGRAALRWAATSWYLIAVAGQFFFALYITWLYGGGALRGDPTVLSTVMPRGYIRGDTVGNVTVVTHLVLAVVIILGGALQMVPMVRRRFPAVHRVTGRSYIVAALLISLGGLYLVWSRGTVGNVEQHLASTLNAVLMLTFAVLAWRAARQRRFAVHRRWALRLFLVASGVWFFRVGLMLWLLIHQRPVGFDPQTFQGPFLTALAFGESLVPLAVLEAYLWAQERGEASGRLLVAAVLVILTVGTAAGIFGAAMGLWLPRMR